MSCCCSTVHRATSAHFGDERAREELAAYHQSGAGRTTRRLGRITWREGDFVSLAPSLADADVVTLDRVVCCYPAYEPLLHAAASHSRRFLAMSYPRDRWYVRLVLWVENLGRRLRRDAFRAFVHPVDGMDAVLRRAGFEAVRDDATLAWAMRVYLRQG